MQVEKLRRALIVTNSELQTFRDCPRKWGFSYHEGLRPRSTPKALTFGSAFHSGVEALYRTIGTLPADEVAEVALAAGLQSIRVAFSQWIERVEADPTSSIESLYADAEEAVATSSWMLRHYVETFRADITRLVPLGVELPFAVSLRNSRGRTLPGITHAGVIDLVAYDPAYGDIVVYDHKSTSSEIGAIDRRVEIDPQMAGYLNALVETLRGDVSHLVKAARLREFCPSSDEAARALLSGSAPVGRVSYNVVRKKMPSVPKVNKDGTVSVAACDTLPGHYRAALEAQEVERGKPVKPEQTEFLARLTQRGDTFIGRREFFRTGKEVEEWRSETFEQTRLIRAAERDAALRYRNPGHCSNPWSLPCSYRSICLDDAPELRAGFTKSERHSEVQAAVSRESAESAGE